MVSFPSCWASVMAGGRAAGCWPRECGSTAANRAAINAAVVDHFRRIKIYSLEREPERQLQLARVLGRRNRVIAAAGHCRTRQIEIRVIEYVEVLDAELQRVAFGEAEVAAESRVEVEETRPRHRIPSFVAERARRRRRDGRGVEPLRSSLRAGIEIADDVRTVVQIERVAHVARVVDGERPGRVGAEDLRELPAAEDLGPGAFVQPPALLAEGEQESGRAPV